MSMSSPAVPPDLQQVFDQASLLHQQGRLAEAQSLLLMLIEQLPAHAEALRLLGVIALQSRQPEQGLAWIERAIAVAPEHPVCHSNRGAALCDLQRLEEAVESFDRAIALKPDYAAAHGNRGAACSRLGRWHEAEASYRHAIAIQPELLDAHTNLGVMLYQQGRHEEAVSHCDRALALRPDLVPMLNIRARALLALERWDQALADFREAIAIHPDFVEAQRGLAETLQSLGRMEEAAGSYARLVALDALDALAWSRYGDVLSALARYDEAMSCYDQALSLQPAFAEACCNRGMARLKQRDYAGALADFDQALAIQSEFFEAWSNRGDALLKLQCCDEAIVSFRKALTLQPEEEGAHINLAAALCGAEQYEECVVYCDKVLERWPDSFGVLCNRASALQELYRMDEAAVDFARCVALDPDNAENLCSRGMFELRMGRFEQGWPLYEWRRRRPDAVTLPPGAAWSGREEVAGKTVVLHGEQGLGDTLQFIRYASLLCDRGAKVTVAVQAPLLRLLRSGDSRIAYVTADQVPARADFRSALMSMPLAFGTRLDTIPATPGYLRADPLLVEAWGRVLPVRTRPRIGLVWSGSSTYASDRKRSLLLQQLEPMLSFPADWYVLQKDVRPEDANTLARLPHVIHLGEALGDFANTAALVDHLDLVISVDTSLAHLAGALGKPVWILLSQVPDWRWMLDRDDSPWYPGARLFRQTTRGDWAPVVERVRKALDAAENVDLATTAQPELADVHADFGTMLYNLGRHEDAVTRFDLALVLRPDFVSARNSRGLALLKWGRLDEALADFASVIATQEDVADAHRGRADVLRLQGHAENAAASYARAVALDPGDAPTLQRYGEVLAALGRYAEAINCYDRLLSLQPASADGYCNRGLMRMMQKDNAGALADIKQALAIQPENFNALNNRGGILVNMGRVAEGVESFYKALALRPEDEACRNNLASALATLGRYEESLACCDMVLERHPDSLKALLNRGCMLEELGRLDEAAAAYARHVALDPDSASGHWNRAVLELRRGNFEQGLPLYEWRTRMGLAQSPSGTIWTGCEDVNGKTVVLHGEQGLGDTLQFIRYASLLCDRGAQVTAVVQAPLLRLLQSSDSRVTYVTNDHVPALADFHSTLMSLPLAFGTRPDTIPASPGYLRTDPALVDAWARALPARTRPRIGLAWSGNAAYISDSKRSLSLRQLEPMLSFPADWYVLQKDVRPEDADTLARLPQVIHPGDALGDFANTAALMDHLDLVISVDTSIGHLAGALGRPLWTLLSHIADWRWMLDRDDSPWYPSARLFRQAMRGDWATVIERVHKALTERTW
jgi:tetratricopeptide (TPR) repeat protein